jgi:hypothetical protein
LKLPYRGRHSHKQRTKPLHLTSTHCHPDRSAAQWRDLQLLFDIRAVEGVYRIRLQYLCLELISKPRLLPNRGKYASSRIMTTWSPFGAEIQNSQNSKNDRSIEYPIDHNGDGFHPELEGRPSSAYPSWKLQQEENRMRYFRMVSKRWMRRSYDG